MHEPLTPIAAVLGNLELILHKGEKDGLYKKHLTDLMRAYIDMGNEFVLRLQNSPEQLPNRTREDLILDTLLPTDPQRPQ